MKKLWPTLLGLTVGALALWIFFAWLFTLFQAERDDGAREALAHRSAVEAYALAEVTAALRAQLKAASEQLVHVQRDPLLDDSGLYLAVEGAQVVPPPPSKNEQASADASEGSPLAQRRALLVELRAAVDRGDRPAIERHTRALLSERARYVIPFIDDAPLVLEVVAALQQAGPAPELTRMLLRDGVSTDGKSVPLGLEGLQRALLRRRTRLSDEQLASWCTKIARASRQARVPAADFEARCQSAASPRPPAWQLFEGESFWRGERTWFVRANAGLAEGAAVDLDALLLELTLRLRSRQLLSSADALRFEVPLGSSALAAQTVKVAAPQWDVSARRRDERFVLKSLLLAVSAALTLAIAALAVLAQRRKLRFVELKSDFVATVSHELRTPLASMRVMAETLERRLEGHALAKDYPARIVREVDGLSTLVENILSFNRLDKGRWRRRDEDVALAALVPALQEEAARYPSAKVQLSFTGFEGAVLRADRELVQLLFVNLLRNACKYNEADPVRVSFEHAGGVVRVTDNGVGIPAAEHRSVFIEFNRLPGQRGRGGAGSGLGLALARRIMALHAGTIDVGRSGPEGTTFVRKFG